MTERRNGDSLDDEPGDEEFAALLGDVAAAPPVDPEAMTGSHVLQPGTVVGRPYRIERILGRGGTAIVYLAESLELRRQVAIKVLARTADRDRLVRLRREAKTMARLSHENVLTVHDVGEYQDQVYVVMEYVDGGTLRRWLRKRRAWREVLDAFMQAGEGLAAAHRVGIVHRDFKPDNALIGRDGRVRVGDFGLARVVGAQGSTDRERLPSTPEPESGSPERESGSPEPESGSDSARLTATGAVMGTPAYMSPEQLAGQAADERSDQFSFCVAAYEALAGVHPFPAESIPELRSRVREGRVKPPIRRHVPKRLVRALAKGLRTDPLERWASMDVLLAQLQIASARRSALVVAGLAIATPVAVWFAQGDQQACGDEREELEGIWDAAVVAEVESVFARIGDVSFGELEQELDAYSAHWVEARREVCERARSGDAQLVDQQVTCLRRARSELAGLTAVLRDDETQSVESVGRLTRGLWPIERCEDLDALESSVSPPSVVQAPGVDALRTKLSSARATIATGRYAEAAAVTREVVVDAKRIGYGPFLADALLTLGSTLGKLGHYSASVEALEQAYFEAVASADEKLALEAAVSLTGRSARHGRGLEDAKRWYEVARSLSDRAGSDEHREAQLLASLGDAYYFSRMAPEAIRSFREAIAIKERIKPDGSSLIGWWISLANSLALDRQFGPCAEAAQEAIRRGVAHYGPDHPMVAVCLGTFAECKTLTGDGSGAEEAARRAVRILLAAQGPDSINVADAYGSLAGTLQGQGKTLEAIEARKAVLAIIDRVNTGDAYDRALSRFDLAQMLIGVGQTQEAEETLKAGLAILRAASVSVPLLEAGSHLLLGRIERERKAYADAESRFAQAQKMIGTGEGPEAMHLNANVAYQRGALAHARGDFEGARQHFSRARDIFTEQSGPGHIEVLRSIAALADSDVERGAFDEAIAVLRDARPQAEGLPQGAGLRATIDFALARATWRRGGSQREATARAAAALEQLGPGPQHARLRSDLEAWLRSPH